MGKPTGFKEYSRLTPNRFPIDLRLKNFDEWMPIGKYYS